MSEIDNLRAENERLKAGHCRDCCCARSWEALGNPTYSGTSIPEHIVQLRRELAEAAMEIDCAGPVAHRIRKLKLELSTEITLLRCELTEVLGKLEGFAEQYPCHCAQRYPGSTAWHGHDCEKAQAQEFVARFLAAKKG